MFWVTATYLPGTENTLADYESRKEYKEAEWKLNPKFFISSLKTLNFEPTVDCFAGRLNFHLPAYVSYRPGPFAKFTNAFSLNWSDIKGYFFPTFQLNWQSPSKDKDRQSRGNDSCTSLENSTLVYNFSGNVDQGTGALSIERPAYNATESRVTPVTQELSLMVGIV